MLTLRDRLLSIRAIVRARLGMRPSLPYGAGRLVEHYEYQAEQERLRRKRFPRPPSKPVGGS